MTISELKDGQRARFKVIEGGPPEPPVSKAKKAVRASRAKTIEMQASERSPISEERLRKAILQLPVEGCGLTVEQALEENSQTIDREEDWLIFRFGFLEDKLKAMGLKVHGANPALELERDCFLVLTEPERLLAKHPELAPLNPEAYFMLTMG